MNIIHTTKYIIHLVYTYYLYICDILKENTHPQPLADIIKNNSYNIILSILKQLLSLYQFLIVKTDFAHYNFLTLLREFWAWEFDNLGEGVGCLLD